MRASIVSAASILLCGSVGLAASDPSSPPSANRPLAEVSFTLYQNGIIVPAVIDGGATVHLLLDTGWGPLALVSTAATRLGLHPKGPGEYPRVTVGSLAVGGAVQKKASFEVLPAEELEPMIGPHDGVLSTAFFRDLVLQIDYPSRVVRFYARSPIAKMPPAMPGARASLPMVFSPRAGALPFTDAVLVDGKPARALFDTGGAGGFMAMEQLVGRMSLSILPETGAGIAIGMLSNGQATQQKVRFARVDRIALGPFVVDSPRVMVAPSQLEGSDWGHDLNIGYGFMRDYIVTFDYPGKVITFERSSMGAGWNAPWRAPNASNDTACRF
jgi:predicted aspartyl protease